MSTNCVLMGGQPRSGTSLLTSLLRESDNLFQGFELHIRKPSFLIGNNKNYTRNIFKQLGLPFDEFDAITKNIYEYSKNMNLGAWVGPKEEVSAEPLTGKETNMFEAELKERGKIVTKLMQKTAQIYGKERWGFKILGDIIYADIYSEVWPNSVFILLVRDPRDHALSIMKMNEQRMERGQQLFYENYSKVALGWKETIRGGNDVLSKNNIPHITIRYEDIVLSPETTLSKLENTLDLDLSKSKDFYKSEFIKDHLQRFRHHDNLKNPINANSVGKWKLKMTEEEVSIFKEIAGDVMEKYDYL